MRDKSLSKIMILPILVLMAVCLMAIPAWAEVWQTDADETSVTIAWDTPSAALDKYVEATPKLISDWDEWLSGGKNISIGTLVSFKIEWGQGSYPNSQVVNADTRSYKITGLQPENAYDVRVSFRFLADYYNGKTDVFFDGDHGTTVATTLESILTCTIPEPADWKKQFTSNGWAEVRIPASGLYNDWYGKDSTHSARGYEGYIVSGPFPYINPENEYPERRHTWEYVRDDGTVMIGDNFSPANDGVATVSVRPFIMKGIQQFDSTGAPRTESTREDFLYIPRYALGGWITYTVVADAPFKVTRKKSFKKTKNNSLTVTIEPVKYASHYEIYVSELTKKDKLKGWKKVTTVHAIDGQRVKKKIQKFNGKYINPKKYYAVKVVTVSGYGQSNGDTIVNVH